MEKAFLTIKELSEYTNLRPSTLYTLVETRKVPHYRFGRLIRFKKLDVDRWIENHRKNAIDVCERVSKMVKVVKNASGDPVKIVKKSIAEAKANRLSFRSREARPNQGPQKGG
jgi:excisionase family DNA binding protein